MFSYGMEYRLSTQEMHFKLTMTVTIQIHTGNHQEMLQ